jgi:alkyl hydroperoxide reductase subunit F
MHDLTIIGGGPAGATAAVYAARKHLDTVLVTAEWGGQSNVSADIQNWIGTPHISGMDLAKNLRLHTEEYASTYMRTISPASVQSLTVGTQSVTVTLSTGESIESRTLFVASGANRRTLDIPGAREFEHKGLTYCASCDGPLFADQEVVVVGGGNAAFETALQLLAYCSKVTLVHRNQQFRADEITIATARANPKMHITTDAVPTRVLGDAFVSGFVYTDTTGTETTVPASGIFVEIGSLPNTAWLSGAVKLTPTNNVIVDPYTQRAQYTTETIPCRIWAAGDCTDGLYHQNNIAVGDAVKATEDMYSFIQKDKNTI